MIDLRCLYTDNHFQQKPFFVVGLGKTGLAVLKALKEADITALAYDDNDTHREAAEELGAKWITEPLELDYTGCAAVVLAPGIPLHFPEPHPICKKANEAECPIICDIELFGLAKKGKNKIVGITGTNGKSTTTALAAHVINKLGSKAVAGGNIGYASLDLPDYKEGDGIYVLELSSFQIDLCPTFRPDIAVLLNITPDHLDRHGDFDGYVAAKAQLFDGAGVSIVTSNDDGSRTIAKQAGVPPILDIPMVLNELPQLAGEHNAQNIRAVYLICRNLFPEMTGRDFRRALTSFAGLEHRQEIVGELNGTTFINDSKATNPDAAAYALNTYKNIYWIAGGRSKDPKDFDGLIKDHGQNIKHAFLIGEAQEDLQHYLEKYNIPATMCHELPNALTSAMQSIIDNGTSKACILLSPACASFDQFPNFEKRGEAFQDLVQNMMIGNTAGKADMHVIH